jgi:malate dehydrogenase (oxaloacetate-decarboxylating)
MDKMDYFAESLAAHKKAEGKLRIQSKLPLETKDDLSIAYTPGVAEPSRRIAENPEDAYTYTIKKNTVAVASDGSAVLGLGNIGGLAAIPVMEGKCALFGRFAKIDAFPICLSSQNPSDIIRTVIDVAPVFGGINLEDIAAPKCFEIEEALKEALSIPVFHDDQHGTAIVACAAVFNALKIVGKEISSARFALSGAGAAGIAVARMLLGFGARDIVVCDSRGPLAKGRGGMSVQKEALAEATNPGRVTGSLADAVRGADVFIGVSAAGALTGEMVRAMAKDPIVFAMANPDPEILPEEAFANGARIVGTGRSDYPNQINNVLAFPGVFRGALDSRAPQITEGMKRAAASALAGLVGDEDLESGIVIPSPFDERVAQAVSGAVKSAAQA